MKAMEQIDFTAPSWNCIYELLLDLAVNIWKSSFKPDIVVGVSRGGWVPARVLSDLLDNSNLANIRVEFYSSINQTIEKPVITQPLSVPVLDKKVLVVDDIVDSGASLRLVHNTLSKAASQVKSAVIYVKPWAGFHPDYFASSTDTWVIFPWELAETIRILMTKRNQTELEWHPIEVKLINAGVNATLVTKLFNYVVRRST
jgi:hypoxanthine phosphoribosyltransferase